MSNENMSARIEEMRRRMREGTITPKEAAQSILEMAQSLSAQAGGKANMDVTVPMRAALYAMGRADIADTLVQITMDFMPDFGIAVSFVTNEENKMTEQGLLTQEDVLNSDVGSACNDAVDHTLKALGFKSHRHEDGTLHVHGHEDIDKQVEKFRHEIEQFDQPPPDPNSVIGKWG